MAILAATVLYAPENMSGAKKGIITVFAALLAGHSAYFFTGALGIERSWIKASGGMGAFVIILILFPKLSPTTELYRVRVTALGPGGNPVDDVEVMASVGGEKKKVQGGWELDIPEAVLPADRKLTIYAEKPSAFWSGYQQIYLGKDFHPTLTIQLQEHKGAKIQGLVLDESGNALPGAKVSIVGHENEAAAVGASGEFTLNAHAARGRTVRLRVEMVGFKPLDQYHPAGSGPVTLLMERNR